MMRTLTGRMSRSLVASRERLRDLPTVSAPTSASGPTSETTEATLGAAVDALDELPGFRLRSVSRLYATEPVGFTDQAEFRNAVAALDVPAGADPATGALRVLEALKGLERQFGRRPRRRWGPRELDLDLLVFGRARIAVERTDASRSVDARADPSKAPRLLEVPHPAVANRLFVLAPSGRSCARAGAARLGLARSRPRGANSPGSKAPMPCARSAPGTRPFDAGRRSTPAPRASREVSRDSGSRSSVSMRLPVRPALDAIPARGGRDATTSTRSVPRKTSPAPSSAAWPPGRTPRETRS